MNVKVQAVAVRDVSELLVFDRLQGCEELGEVSRRRAVKGELLLGKRMHKGKVGGGQQQVGTESGGLSTEQLV